MADDDSIIGEVETIMTNHGTGKVLEAMGDVSSARAATAEQAEDRDAARKWRHAAGVCYAAAYKVDV